jgi:hypothetical protein
MYKILKNKITKALFTKDGIRILYLCAQCYIGIIPEKDIIKNNKKVYAKEGI